MHLGYFSSYFVNRIAFVSGAGANWTYTVKRVILSTQSPDGRGTVGTLRSWNFRAWTDYLRVGHRLTHPDATTTASPGGPAGSRAWVDRYMLARDPCRKAEAEPYIGKVAVGAVVLNWIKTLKFPIRKAGSGMYQPLAFESVA